MACSHFRRTPYIPRYLHKSVNRQRTAIEGQGQRDVFLIYPLGLLGGFEIGRFAKFLLTLTNKEGHPFQGDHLYLSY